MNPKIWFVLIDGQVTGPFDQNEVTQKSQELPDLQIWGRGQGEWVPLQKWKQSLKELPQISEQDTQNQEMWKVRLNGHEKSAANYASMIQFLRTVKEFGNVDVSVEPHTNWKDLYSVPQIVEDLGISRRSHPRVPIVGSLAIEREGGESATYRVISISEGGLGINDSQNMQIGQTFKGTLTSPNLYVSIDMACEVVYVGNDGYAGIRFVGLPAEFKTSIVEYVNKFTTG